MYISKLKRIIEQYDQYGVHRLNGVKVVYVLVILFTCNLFFNIPNVYFNFFYIPITAMTIEVMFEQIQDKYWGFTYAVVGTAITVFLFSIFRPFPLFFLLSAFVIAALLYVFILHRNKQFLPIVPIILSLASYSLIYKSLNMNIYMVTNNAITTLIALVIILSALMVFPLSYYYRLWLRAFILLLQEINHHFLLVQDGKTVHFSLSQGHTKHMVTFAQMLPRKLPTFTILKINLLANRLHMESCVLHEPLHAVEQAELIAFIEHFTGFMHAVKNEKSFKIHGIHNQTLLKLIRAWNALCLKM